ncbi:MAG TPA: ATP synthase F0 subunit B [Oligoflexia bacterium]|nr:ATP synthase F0 subunit B [Oligoflexia bacterium]
MKKTKIYALFLPLLLICSSAYASGPGAGHEAGLSTLIFPAINFVLYAGVIVFAYFKCVRKMLKQRSSDVAESLARAAQTLEQAQAELDDAKRRLAVLEKEKYALSGEFREQGRLMQESIKADSQKNAERIRRDTERRIAGELKKARAEIRQEVSELAAKLARMKLAQELSPEQDRRLREETVNAVES